MRQEILSILALELLVDATADHQLDLTLYSILHTLRIGTNSKQRPSRDRRILVSRLLDIKSGRPKKLIPSINSS